jgi:hypothetical protein
MAIAAGATAGPTKMPMLMYTKPKPRPRVWRTTARKPMKTANKQQKNFITRNITAASYETLHSTCDCSAK